ncbi:23S rRNA (adenine(1618)-N(6))-methyltransferase RlmF [Psychroserpens sp. SPM9]|uniref:23S rRNA (adenine(1618)-N(6))-methyltransferase RlmF n=1 Tax=Psychroserpens sp. SPM9 TaxID=2975598 RepID=UPI0021A6321F|nr:23S rRNA (adenine(1618)-N(6))-methyltransferase RlmF [Psychroserpens sp. SPM9]MDG5493186.1 23S rRNA (adenine(1618)-N(6))-methyltransferase RlmF [Psychroserpens sp. SPM9]
MHKKHTHSNAYDFEELVAYSPELKAFVKENAYGNLTIDFANPKAVKTLNKALLKQGYGIEYWEFPDAHLCPPIPGRVAYIHVLKDLLDASKLTKNISVLDIGTGATCIYPLLGHAEYGWKFMASEVDQDAFNNAQTIIDTNALNAFISLKLQKQQAHILTGILNTSETITATMCNPPFYKNEAEAIKTTERKLKGLGKHNDKVIRNFSGTAKELWYPGGEKAFLHNYLYQSSLLKDNCFWFTSLVSKKALVESMEQSLKKLGATQVKVLDMSIGNKISRVVAWTFLSDKVQDNWKV